MSALVHRGGTGITKLHPVSLFIRVGSSELRHRQTRRGFSFNLRHNVYPYSRTIGLSKGHIGAIGQPVVLHVDPYRHHEENTCLRSDKAINKVIDLLHLSQTDTVWCISAGNGTLPMQIARSVAKVIVTDTSESRIAELRKRLGDVGAQNVETHIADPLSFPISTFDVCCAVESPFVRPRVLFRLLEFGTHIPSRFRLAVLSLAKGTAHRVAAQPGTTLYSRLSANIQRFAAAKLSRVEINAEDFVPRLRSVPYLIEMKPNPVDKLGVIEFLEWQGFTSVLFRKKGLKIRGLVYTPSICGRLEADYKSSCAANKRLPSTKPFPLLVKDICNRRNIGHLVPSELSTDTLGILLEDFHKEGIRFATVGREMPNKDQDEFDGHYLTL